jgi:hypothetical protein
MPDPTPERIVFSDAEPEEPPLEVLSDDASWDAELQALVAIVNTLEPLDKAARHRVMLWARSRYLPDHLLVSK